MRHTPDYSIVDGRHGLTGAELRRWREALDLTQEAAAEVWGLSRVHWGMMERGQKPVSRPVAHYIRWALQGVDESPESPVRHDPGQGNTGGAS